MIGKLDSWGENVYKYQSNDAKIPPTLLPKPLGKSCRDSSGVCQNWTRRLNQKASICGLRAMEGKILTNPSLSCNANGNNRHYGPAVSTTDKQAQSQT